MSANITRNLAGKVALVTGGSRGIGVAIAKRLAADGAAVALTYSASPAKADEVARSIKAAGGKALAIKADAADTEAVRLAIAKTIGAFGGIDILVNSTGFADAQARRVETHPTVPAPPGSEASATRGAGAGGMNTTEDPSPDGLPR
jgi:NAD(P)-dependent dehydrogenase (short-subunit alcohol dehydrogenase family)